MASIGMGSTLSIESSDAGDREECQANNTRSQYWEIRGMMTPEESPVEGSFYNEKSPEEIDLDFASCETKRVPNSTRNAAEYQVPDRRLRSRTAAQLRPFSVENAKYTRSLLQNGWKGAVVSNRRQVDLTTEELLRRKEAAIDTPKDNLGGWLEYENGQRVVGSVQNEAKWIEGDRYTSEESDNGSVILRLQMQKKPLTCLAAAAMSRKGKERAEYFCSESDDDSSEEFAPDLPSWSEVRDHIEPRMKLKNFVNSSKSLFRASGTRRTLTRNTMKCAKLTSSRGPDIPRRHGQELCLQRKVGGPRALNRTCLAEADSGGASGMVREVTGSSKFIHQRNFTRRREGIDRQISLLDNLTRSRGTSCSADEYASPNGSCSSSPITSSSSNATSSSLSTPVIRNAQLDRKRKRALKMMMPAVFMKKAQADLHLMEREKRDGITSGSDWGSGDEEQADKRDSYRDESSLETRSFLSGNCIKPMESLSDPLAYLKRQSPDFGISKVLPGMQLDLKSVIGRGHLFNFLEKKESMSPFSPLLSTAMPPDVAVGDAVDLLPQMFANIRALLPSDLAETSRMDDSLLNKIIEILQSLSLYCTVTLPSEIRAVRSSFSAHLEEHFNGLRANFGSLLTSVTVEESRRRLLEISICVSWFQFETATRICALDHDGVRCDYLRDAGSSLVRTLLDYGLNRTMDALRLSTAVPSDCPSPIEDVSLNVWAGLISVSLYGNSIPIGFCENDFWQMICNGIKHVSSKSREGRSLLEEALAHAAMSLSAISQFNTFGTATVSPRLHAFWPLLSHSIELLQLDFLHNREQSIQLRPSKSRDRKIAKLFTRCAILSNRWMWILDIRSVLLPQLFDILNARNFANLSFEDDGTFPSFLLQPGTTAGFLRKLDHAGHQEPVFHTFLGLLLKAADDMSVFSEEEKQRQLTRLFLRLSPPESSRQRFEGNDRRHSQLINHYSLYLTFAAVCQTSLSQRLNQARRLQNFAEADHNSRSICLQAVSFFGILSRQSSTSSEPVLNWLSAIVQQLFVEYQNWSQHETGRQNIRHIEALRTLLEQDYMMSNMKSSIVSFLVLSFRIMQNWILKNSDTDLQFPDKNLLSPAWKEEIIESGLVSHPDVGIEAVKCINCFLDVREQIIAKTSPHKSHRMSQDEFGPFDVDLDDPALNELLGISSEENNRNQTFRAMDLDFLQFLHSSLAPLLFRFLSALLDGMATPYDHSLRNYVDDVIRCWTRCILVIINGQLSDWTPFWQYGTYSWRRLSHPIERRHVGLILAVKMLENDSLSAQVLEIELLELWFQTIVARRITMQHLFTRQLLESPFSLKLFAGSSLLASFRVHGVTQSALLSHRLEVLKDVFSSIGEISTISEGFNRDASRTRSQIVHYLRGMLAAMRDNLTTHEGVSSISQTYATFCRSVLKHMSACGTSILDQTILERRNLLRDISH